MPHEAPWMARFEREPYFPPQRDLEKAFPPKPEKRPYFPPQRDLEKAFPPKPEKRPSPA